MRKRWFYGVHRGRIPGIYSTWKECEAQVTGFVKPVFKKFENKDDAKTFVQYGSFKQEKKSKTKTKIEAKSNSQNFPKVLLNKSNANDQIIKINDGRIIVYTDGSSRGNGKKGAYAGFGVYFGKNDPRNISEKLEGSVQTNQRAEITAALKAVEVTDPKTVLEIRTDSQYVINAMTSWVKLWVKNGWKTSNGGEVMNRDLFDRFQILLNRREASVIWTHVRGHVGIEGNEMADQLANEGAAKHIKI